MSAPLVKGLHPALFARRDALADAFGAIITQRAPAPSEVAMGAITRATRVQITHAVISAFRPNLTEGSEAWHKTRKRLRAAFEAAGFEVVE